MTADDEMFVRAYVRTHDAVMKAITYPFQGDKEQIADSLSLMLVRRAERDDRADLMALIEAEDHNYQRFAWLIKAMLDVNPMVFLDATTSD